MTERIENIFDKWPETATTDKIDKQLDELQKEAEKSSVVYYPQDSEEDEVVRKYAEAHGFELGNEQYTATRPMPCVRDEHGEIKEQTVKDLFKKVNEELDELKAAVLSAFYSLDVVPSDRPDLKNVNKDDLPCIADEAADTITAITTMLEALGIDAKMRDEAQRRVNEKNRNRGRI